MSPVTKQIANMIDMPPENEQQPAFEFIKRMVLAWDSDFARLTPFERERLLETDKEFLAGEVVDHNEMDWD